MAHETEQPGSIERVKDFGTGRSAVVGRWMAEIRSYEATFRTWHERGRKIIERYRNEAEDQDQDFARPASKFAILWSNTQTLQPVIYSRPPKPDIARRHKDKDTVARTASIVLERAVETAMEDGGFHAAMKAARDDYLLVARGQVWVRYEPKYGDETKEKIYLQQDTAETGERSYRRETGEAIEGEPMFDETGEPFIEGEPYSPVIDERIKIEHVPWERFGHTPAPNWDKVRAVWKCEYMTRDQLIERFGEEKGKNVDLTRSVPNVRPDDQKIYGDTFKRGEVYEIWDRTAGKVMWVSPGYSTAILDEIDDPLHLRDFFPCPRPFYGTVTTDSLVPIPDYSQYRVQAEEIDRLTKRIMLLTEALAVKGVYNSAIGDMKRLLDARENTLIPVDNWAMFAESGGMEGNISFLPVEQIANVLFQLVQIREQMKRDLFEVTGISDLVRGQGQASETATAQRIKGHFAGIRIEDRKSAMGEFARDVVRIVTEIMAEHFDPGMLMDMSGWEYSEEAAALDRAADEWRAARQQEQQEQIEAMQAMQQPPAPAMPDMGMEGQPAVPNGGAVEGLMP